MKKLLLKLFLLFFIIAATNNIFFKLLRLPFCWGNDIAYAKSQYFLKHKSEFNSIFIGTSRTYWQADVAYFDSLTRQQTKSFNFGIDAIAAAEIFYYTDNLVNLNESIRYVFIEVYDIDLIVKNNLHTLREKYWYNFDSWIFTVRAILGSTYKIKEKCRGVFYNTITFFEWLLKFDLLKDVVRFKDTPANEGYLGNNHNGFVALGEEKVDVPEHLGRRRLLLSDTSINSKLRVASLSTFANYAVSNKLNYAYYNKLNEIVKYLQGKNIQVFLMMAPRSAEVQYSDIVPAFMKTDICPKINLADARLNPEFYDLDFVYDRGHLNKAGDRIYTYKIAQAFNETNVNP